MAGKGESERQLLTLIRDFASERSNGERRLAALRKQIEEQSKEFEAANAALEDLKLQKEKVEQELNGCEVELSMNNASIQTFEKRIARIEDAILDVGISIDELKNVEETLREGFINHMLTKNAEIREFKEIKGSTLKVNDQSCLSSSAGMDTLAE
uniref:Uncharacterized protein n=1 Tax=Kalanchoe fedtschenkoi TaxID=63787 RepID=A0A7N0V0M8_KALFE